MAVTAFRVQDAEGSAGTWLVEKVAHLLNRFDLGDTATTILSLAIILVSILLLCGVSYFIARYVIVKTLRILAKKSRTHWDDILVEHRVFVRLSWFAPALVVYFFTTAFPEEYETLIHRVILAFMIVLGVTVVNAVLNAFMAIYKTLDVSRNRPIKGFVDTVKIILFILGGVLAVSALMDRSPMAFLTGIGALTAVLLIVFKDTLLSLVASFQITAGDLVRVGDWIDMSKFGADGDVIEVSLHTVKVRNWDKTITTIPTYALVSDSFKNWRGMSESGGRRIKRSVRLDMSTIRFCTDEMLDRFEKYALIADYVRQKREEINDYNEEHDVDTSQLINGRRITNLGTFRAYLAAYLRSHAGVHKGMTFLVRHLQPEENGLPIEVYVFSRIQAWAEYEAIQADIFDHILAVAPLFDLRVFQNPSGSDFQRVVGA